MKTPFASALLVVSLAACGRSDSKNAPSAPAPDGEPAGDQQSSPAVAVYLTSHLDGDRVLVDVVARGASDIHGAAFRLHWDTAKLAFVKARGSDAWSRQALLLAKEGLPGELVVAWTEKGSGAAINARDDRVLGSLDFTVKTHEVATTLAFRTERSMLVDSKGAPVTVQWLDTDIAAH